MTGNAESPSPEPKGSAQDTALVLALLAVLAAVLRFWRLGDWSFWADEIATLRDAQHLGQVIGYPVGYALIGLAVRLFGTSEFAARLVPAVVGTLSVPALYLIGRKLFSERAAVLSALLLALSPYHLFFSQEARYYTLVMLLVMLGTWCAFVGLERNSRKWLIGAVLLLALAGWTHWTAALALPALALYALWSWPKEGRPPGLRWSNLAILFGPFIAAGVLFVRPILSFLADWRATTGFSIGRSAMADAKLAYRDEPTALICAAIAAWMLLRQGERRGKWLISWALAPSALVVLFVGFSEGGSRFALIALPAFLLLAGEGLDIFIRFASEDRRKVAWILAAVVLLSFCLKDALYFTVERGQRPRWREAAEYLSPMMLAENALVMTAAPAGPEVLEFYLRGAGSLNASRREPPLVGEWQGQHVRWPGQVWYLVVEMTPNTRPAPDLLRFLQENATLVKTFPLKVAFLDYSLLIYRLPYEESKLPAHPHSVSAGTDG